MQIVQGLQKQPPKHDFEVRTLGAAIIMYILPLHHITGTYMKIVSPPFASYLI